MLSLRRVFVTIATLSLLFTATCTLFAAPGDEAGQLSPEARAAQFFAKLDTDGDGKVSREEFPGNDEKFARVDANGDGFITPDEMAGRGGNQGRVGGQQANPQQRWNAMLERFDTDGDGAISAEEFEGPEQVLKALDQDEDGKITQEEALRMADRVERDRRAAVLRAIDGSACSEAATGTAMARSPVRSGSDALRVLPASTATVTV